MRDSSRQAGWLFWSACALSGALFGLTAAAGSFEADYIVGSNAAATNVFLGKVGVGTNNPSSQLHVAGDLTVTGPMKVPKQGDVSMGSYTNGESAGGVTGGSGGGGSPFTNIIGSAAYTNTGFDLAPGSNITFRSLNGTNYVDGLAGGGGSASNGLTHLFRANKGGVNQDCDAGVNTKVTFTNELFDLGDCYAATNSRFTAASDGYYVFNVGVLANAYSSTKATMWVVVNGTNVTGGQINRANTSILVVTPPLHLSSNDYVDVIFNGLAYTWTLEGDALWKSWFSGFRVQ